ncbi:sn-glycerol-3-phosphate ABC transporter ATP-binding protein UgpC [Photobacterium sp. ZSDE20]|uniref:Sn-glycerol-3-phosphate ABC transporter ATP-binding protein UgpC n=1 Tax=Photobacterium pectinilyticum TaxID=2906793 RepID=A0ABT1N7Z8_9GAMM|nr:sn-glycerol-3-phosphate ABC transporter ATP-binding protein UgpC [Photobacterium sp. ZSDE20]MCQ1060889.1 sn-glycerol-3-phosphate ABC transporter ATP-binding protein UgpC [Photobacterium sp. ZSDE20]MDD1828715.1 sn-glycerol-3-phosphate ABC transporter ATP-binding protein UgpC [Photobacterium sp. ZSDE20]
MSKILDNIREHAQSIELKGIKKSYGSNIVIPELDVTIDAGEFVVILGPSGCGKSTTMNMIAGLEDVDGGTISIGQQEVQDLEPKARGCAMVFQNYALYPHMTVADNIGYSLKIRGMKKTERMAKVAEVAKVVSLEDFLERLPSELSGGQRQRVAIGRAIVREPSVLLFDEPLSNLDAKLRHEMRIELSQLHERIGATSVFVTHDQVEAMTLADRIMILNKGNLEQFDTPKNVYDKPATVFVANFIGSPAMNLIENIERDTPLWQYCNLGLLDGVMGDDVIAGIRPEHIEVVEDGGMRAKVTYIEDLGAYKVINVVLASGQELMISTSLGFDGDHPDAIHIKFPEGKLHYFDRQSGLRL